MHRRKSWFRFSLASMLSVVALFAALLAVVLPLWRGRPYCPHLAGAGLGASTAKCSTCHTAILPAPQPGPSVLAMLPAPAPAPESAHAGMAPLKAGQVQNCIACHTSVTSR